MQLPVPLFFVVLHQFLYQQAADIFCRTFQVFIKHCVKKNIFFTNFLFLTDPPKPLHPVNGQNMQTAMKVFC